MTARGAGMFCGGVIAALLIGVIVSWAAAWFYCVGLVVGPALYTNRVPWKL